MKRVPKIIVLSFLLVIGVVSLVYVGILAYIHYDVFGKSPSYEDTRQNFIKNEPYFEKIEDSFLEIADCCLPDSSNRSAGHYFCRIIKCCPELSMLSSKIR